MTKKKRIEPDDFLKNMGLLRENQAHSGFRIYPVGFEPKDEKKGAMALIVIRVGDKTWAVMNAKEAKRFGQDLAKIAKVCAKIDSGELPVTLFSETTTKDLISGGN